MKYACRTSAQIKRVLYLGEYPAGSVSCAESSGELKSGTRNRWFILFTNSMIDWGFVIGAFVPCKNTPSPLLGTKKQ